MKKVILIFLSLCFISVVTTGCITKENYDMVASQRDELVETVKDLKRQLAEYQEKEDTTSIDTPVSSKTSSSTNKNKASSKTSSKVTASKPQNKTQSSNVAKPPSSKSTTSSRPSSDTSGETTGQKNAVKKAKTYLSYLAFSHQGLIKQLEYEKFSSEDAKYGADNCGANWNEQAVKKAKTYLEHLSFSRDSLIGQLEFDGFTHDQAVHGAEANGY